MWITGQFRLSGTCRVLQTLPRAGSAVDLDRVTYTEPIQGMKLPRSEVDQPSWALVPPLGTPHREKASFWLQPEPSVFQLVPLSLVIPPCTSVKSPAVSSSFHPVTSHQCRRSCWVLPKVSLLLADSAVVPQPLIAGQGLQPHLLSGLSWTHPRLSMFICIPYIFYIFYSSPKFFRFPRVKHDTF